MANALFSMCTGKQVFYRVYAELPANGSRFILSSQSGRLVAPRHRLNMTRLNARKTPTAE